MTAAQQALRMVSPAVLAARVRAVTTVNVEHELQACPVPILYLQARHDRLVPPSALTKMQQLRPDVEVCCLDAPHMLLQRQPRAALQEIATFLARRGINTP